MKDDTLSDIKLVKEEDEVVNFNLVEPAKNYKPWTPKYLSILCPLNCGKSSRSASGINGYDDDLDLCTLSEIVKETGDTKEAIIYALGLAGIKVDDSSRFSVDDVLEYMSRAGRPEGWVTSTEFMRISGASKGFLIEMRGKEEHIKPVCVGGTYYYNPDWDVYVIAYRIRRADERAAERLAARKAYKATSNGPLSHMKYYHPRSPDFVPPRPTWLTQAESEGLIPSGKLAKALGVSVDTIRNWTDAGIIVPAKVVKVRNNVGGVRLYKQLDEEETKRLLEDIDEVKCAHMRKRISDMEKRGTLCKKGDKQATKKAVVAFVEAQKKVRIDYHEQGFLILSELTEYLGYSSSYLWRQVKTGKLRYTKKGRNVIVSKKDADEWRRRHIEELSGRWKSKMNTIPQGIVP